MQKLRDLNFSPSRNNFKCGAGKENTCLILAFLNSEIMDRADSSDSRSNWPSELSSTFLPLWKKYFSAESASCVIFLT